MPGMGMGLGMHLEQRLEQRLQQAMHFDPDDANSFKTDEEKINVSQYDILEQLLNLIKEGDYIDPDHFGLEINRTIFGHALESRLSRLGLDIEGIIKNYESSEDFVQKAVELLTKQKESEKRKDIPGQIASYWNRISSSKNLKGERKNRRIPRFIEKLGEKDADIESGMSIVSQSAELGQKELLNVSMQRIEQFAEQDKRKIPFSQEVLSRLFRYLRNNKEELTEEESNKVYDEIVENLYMLDRELRNASSLEGLSDYIKKNGIRGLLSSTQIPAPIKASLEEITLDSHVTSRFMELCQDEDFKQGRELKRKIYSGLSSINEFENGEEILEHIVENSTNSRGIARILDAFNLTSHDPQFAYPFELKGENEIVRNLRLQLTDKSIRRLGLEDATLEKYLAKVDSDSKFAQLGKIFTKLASYSHYKPEQIALMREVISAELEGKFKEWRYKHDKSQDQLKSLGPTRVAWMENSKVSRVIGELDSLNSHIESVKESCGKLLNNYEEHYKQKITPETLSELNNKMSDGESKLKAGQLSARETKELGYQTSLVREQLAYASLINEMRSLSNENYEKVMKNAQGLSKRKTKNPLSNSAKWVYEVLDQPVYRDARKISIEEKDDLESLLRMGEIPIPHCQDWRSDSTYNSSLLSFVADSNKKLYHINDNNGKSIGMSLVRLVDWNGTTTLLAENAYSNEWSLDHAIALLGSLAEKVAEISRESGKSTILAIPDYSGHDGHSTNRQLKEALKRFGEQYDVYVADGVMEVTPAKSKNTREYWNCGPGIVDSGKEVSLNVSYIEFK